MDRKYFIINIILTLVILILLGGVGYILDPSQQIRYNSNYVAGEQRLVNMGLARNYNYTSIIIGSSTSENILKEDVDRLFDTNSINLSLSGSTAYEHRKILNEIVKSEKCKLVIYGVDFFNYNWEVDKERVKIEDYSKNISKYLYNVNTLKEEIKIFFKILLNKNLKNWIYKWSYWGDLYTYSERQLLSFDKDTQWGAQNIGILKTAQQGYNLNKMKENFKEFLKVIEKNKNIEYKIYFLPYSSLYWYMIKETNNLEVILSFKKYVAQEIKKYPNIVLYDFQLKNEIVNNFDNYKDAVHFSPKINLQIIKLIKNNENRVKDFSDLEVATNRILEEKKEKFQILNYIINQK